MRSFILNTPLFEPLLSKYARYRKRYPVYFFHHIPKCGGTSMREALNGWFTVNSDYFIREKDHYVPPVNLGHVNTNNCIIGHFGHPGYFIDERYPKIFKGFRARSRYRIFMFLREPLEMRCSLYRHDLLVGEDKQPNLAAAITTFNNYYSRILNVTENNWKKKLDRYFFIGMADDLQTSFDLLGSLIGKPKLDLPISNTTASNHETSIDSLSAEQIDDFKKANALDYQIFNYARQRMKNLLEESAGSSTVSR